MTLRCIAGTLKRDEELFSFTPEYARKQLSEIVANEDLSRYIL